MSHSALEFENWEIIKIEKDFSFSYNKRVLYSELKISAVKFYFFLKQRFGQPNVHYSQVSQFFLEKHVTTGNEWCYLFQSSTNFILVGGDDLINIAVLSINEPPEKLDFDIFCSNINSTLEKSKLNLPDDSCYDIYVNYGFLLNNLINDYKSIVNQKLPVRPDTLTIQLDELDTKDPTIQYKWIEYARDYNLWLKSTLEQATLSIQIQILLPIYFESLIDLAFRIKLQKSYFDDNKRYGRDNNKRIFEYFEGLNIHEKLSEIRQKCFSIDDGKMLSFIKSNYDNKMRKKRNKLLHGNSLFLKNLNLRYYLVRKPNKFFPIQIIS